MKDETLTIHGVLVEVRKPLCPYCLIGEIEWDKNSNTYRCNYKKCFGKVDLHKNQET